MKKEISTTDKLKWVSQHVPVSVSIASNVSSYEEAVCFVDENSVELIDQMMNYLSEISAYNKGQMVEKYNYILVQLDNLISKYAHADIDSTRMESEKTSKTLLHIFKSLCAVKRDLMRYISQLPVIGFNCGRYDINLIKRDIIGYITQNYNENDIYTIKKNNSYLSISVPDLKFIDISN